MHPYLPSTASHAMPRIPTVLPNLFAAVLLTASSLAMAQQAPPSPRDRDRDRGPERELQQAPRVSLSDAVRRVERNTRGEVLSAERIQFDGRDMHRVKVVDDQGRVRVFMQDPARRDRPSPPRPQNDDE
jgi:hypothetical protein